jgi:predicted DNA-binding WGR domain protein
MIDEAEKRMKELLRSKIYRNFREDQAKNRKCSETEVLLKS